MTAQTVMTPNDVIKYSGVKLPFNPCSFSELFTIEYDQARRCLGFDLWTALKEGMADYSAAVEFQSGTTYNLDDVVTFRGFFYQVKVLSTNNIPTVATDWMLAPKFEGDCAESFDTFFCLYLGPYLAKKVLHVRLPYIKSRITDLGVLEYNDSVFETSEEESVVRLQTAIGRDAAMAWGNLQHFMNQDAQKENDCFAGYLEYQNDDCGDSGNNCKPKNKRIGLYKFG